MSPTPLLLSPALPSELLNYILSYHAYPTTLIICTSQADFLSSLARDLSQQAPSPAAEKGPRTTNHPPPRNPRPPTQHALLASPLHQVATSRHIRVVHAPTVTHLRAYLSVFSPSNPSLARVPAPPTPSPASGAPPALLVYGLLALHRRTSEWSAQGLGATAAALVELAYRLGWQAVLVEPLVSSSSSEATGEGTGEGEGNAQRLEDLLAEEAPVLSGGVRRKIGVSGGSTWAGRTVEVGRVLGRWFRFQRGVWDDEGGEEEDGRKEGEGEEKGLIYEENREEKQ
ncbi:hypothetical protein F4810DRAFT_721991 [Camillea tinctor]|nr:hypothetical protein F4810DRAFT_721991 [Camillea tinctor]